MRRVMVMLLILTVLLVAPGCIGNRTQVDAILFDVGSVMLGAPMPDDHRFPAGEDGYGVFVFVVAKGLSEGEHTITLRVQVDTVDGQSAVAEETSQAATQPGEYVTYAGGFLRLGASKPGVRYIEILIDGRRVHKVPVMFVVAQEGN